MTAPARRPAIGGVLALGAALLASGGADDQPRRDPTAVSPGAVAYATYCAVCHGERGRGDGPLAPLLAGPLQDLTTLSRRNGGRFPLERVRRAIDGRRPIKAHGAMPAWGDVFRERHGDQDQAADARERITQLASFLASIQQETGAERGRAESAICVFGNPGYAGRCTETAELPEGSAPREACEAILACLNSATCLKTYCGATTIRQGWTLESARRVIVRP
jgi:mono/diheme cytochrome c family protein